MYRDLDPEEREEIRKIEDARAKLAREAAAEASDAD
jgi:hypothetical protein